MKHVHLSGALLASGAALACAARAGVPLQWDPSPSTAGIQGGYGVWNSSLLNWQNTAGANVQWSNNGEDTAVFGGTAGGVVSMGINPVLVGHLQFDVAGYTIGQGTTTGITLNGGSVITNVDATVRVPLMGRVVKSGSAVLTLSGSNSLSGGISITSGTLDFSFNYNLGNNSVDVGLDGGNLRYTSAYEWTPASTRQLIVSSVGGSIEANGPIGLFYHGQLTGSGVLTILGTDKLRITATNSAFIGSLNVAGGTLSLSHPDAINHRPVTLSGGTLLLLNELDSTFTNSVNVTQNSALQADRPSVGIVSANMDLGNLTVSSGATLSVSGSNRAGLAVADLNLQGDMRLAGTGLTIRGNALGAGEVRFLPLTYAPWNGNNFGLVFSGTATRTLGYNLTADETSGGSVVVVAGSGATVNFTGAWQAGGTSSQSMMLLREGKFTFTGSARANTLTSDRSSIRPFTVTGYGSSNVVELDGAFVADRTLGGSVADGLGGLTIVDATLLSRGSATLPVVVKNDGFGGTHRAGSLAFSGTSGSTWTLATAAQQYDGGVTFASSGTIQADVNLTHTGITGAKFDGQFQVAAGVNFHKSGAGWIDLSGHQGYAPSSSLMVTAGGVRFSTDPGMGYYSGNYARGGDGNVSAAPMPSGTLAISVGGSGAANVEFAAAVSRIAALELKSGGVARVTAGLTGSKALVVNALTLSGGQLDLTQQRCVVDYAGSNSALAAIRAGLSSGYNAGGPAWQGSGITSSAAQADPTLAIGYGEASSLLGISGTQTASFGPVTVDATSILLGLTRFGDANLDGRVGFADFQRLERNFNQPGTWWIGDFDYDGLVTYADFVLLYQNFGQSVGQASLPISDQDRKSLALFAASVPEPGWGCLAAGAAWLVCRRRRRALDLARR